MWLWLSGLAHGGDAGEVTVVLHPSQPDPYHREFPVVSRYDTDLRARGAERGEAWTEAGGVEIACGVGERRRITVTLRTSNVQTRFPEEVGCRVGDTALTVRIRARPPLYPSVDDVVLTLGERAEWRRSSRGTGGHVQFALPPERQWLPADVSAVTAAGAAWPGLRCRVRTIPEGPLLILFLEDPYLADDTGYCSLPTEGGESMAVPIGIVTVPQAEDVGTLPFMSVYQ